MSFRGGLPDDFSAPTALPKTAAQKRVWQAANRAWWEANPMRYDWKDENPYPEFSAEFYDEIDRRFFADASTFLPWGETPFDALMPFDTLPAMDVLEIGVGNGSHAALLATSARSFVGIDLTSYATRSTRARLDVCGQPGSVVRMDAERLAFPDASFDFIWSWGVIHHSADTGGVLAEMARVLRPGGRAVTMVYHRNAWNYYVVGGLFHGVLQGELFRTRSLHKTVQRSQDGALARFYTRADWRALVSRHLEFEWDAVYGSKMELVPLPAGRVKTAITDRLPDAAGRMFTNRLRMGTFLVSSMRKR